MGEEEAEAAAAAAEAEAEARAALLFTRAEEEEEAITWCLVGASVSLFSGFSHSIRLFGHFVTATAVSAIYSLSFVCTTPRHFWLITIAKLKRIPARCGLHIDFLNIAHALVVCFVTVQS